MLLYKYLCPDRRSILQDRLIRFTPPGSFNDPFDCLPYFDAYNAANVKTLVNKVMDAEKVKAGLAGIHLPDSAWSDAKAKLIRQYSANPSNLASRQLNDSLRPQMNSEVGVLCLSDSKHSILMWSHYANSHTGFLLGFDSEHEFFKQRPGEPEEIGELRAVTYTPDRVRVTVPFSDADPPPDIFFTKNDEWGYEKEWRILRFLKDADKTPAANVHLFTIPSSAIREVVFGRFATHDLISDLILAKKADPDLGHVQFYKATLSPNRFQMDIMPCES
jgi:hypothetical protein